MTKPNNLREIAELSAKVKDLRSAAKRRDLLPQYHEYVLLQVKRIAKNAPIPSVREWLKEKRIQKLENLAYGLPDPGYSMGSTRRVDIVSVSGNVIASGIYSNESSYSGRASRFHTAHGKVLLRLSVKDFLHTKMIGGMVTVVNRRITPGVYDITFFKGQNAKQFFELKETYGFLIKGRHVAFENMISTLEEIHQRKAQRIARVLLERNKMKLQIIAKEIPLSQIFVTVEDSLSAGNCEPGTLQFARREGLDLDKIGAVRADYLLEHSAGVNIYVRRAVETASLRYASMKSSK
jgi:hypothetical protein